MSELRKETPPLCKDAPPVDFLVADAYTTEAFEIIRALILKGRPFTALTAFQIFATTAINTTGLMAYKGIAEKLERASKTEYKDNAAFLLGFIGAIQKECNNMVATAEDNIKLCEEQKSKL